jgi:hypothetical protein
MCQGWKTLRSRYVNGTLSRLIRILSPVETDREGTWWISPSSVTRLALSGIISTSEEIEPLAFSTALSSRISPV